MQITKERLTTALSLMQRDEDEKYFFTSSEFVKTAFYITLNTRMGDKFPPVAKFMQYIEQDLLDILTITSRLEWERSLWAKNELTLGQWTSYAQCDIDMFHVELRSIFDYVAKVLTRISNQPKQVPDEGFNILKTWLEKNPENHERLSKDLAELVLSNDWYKDFKNVRDEIVHRGAFTMVFLDKESILFQVDKGYENLVSIPEIMYNDNVVFFELYSAMYFGYLIAFLEDFAKALIKRLPKGTFSYGAGNVRTVYQDLPVIYSWVDRLIRK